MARDDEDLGECFVLLISKMVFTYLIPSGSFSPLIGKLLLGLVDRAEARRRKERTREQRSARIVMLLGDNIVDFDMIGW